MQITKNEWEELETERVISNLLIIILVILVLMILFFYFQSQKEVKELRFTNDMQWKLGCYNGCFESDTINKLHSNSFVTFNDCYEFCHNSKK
jgi:hypothetical protein